MGVLLQNRQCLCPTEPRPAPSQKLPWFRGPQPRCLMMPAAMAPYASQWHPTPKKTAAPRGTAPTPPCLPRNGAHEESWTKKATWPLCETKPSKVHAGCSERRWSALMSVRIGHVQEGCGQARDSARLWPRNRPGLLPSGLYCLHQQHPRQRRLFRNQSLGPCLDKSLNLNKIPGQFLTWSSLRNTNLNVSLLKYANEVAYRKISEPLFYWTYHKDWAKVSGDFNGTSKIFGGFFKMVSFKWLSFFFFFFIENDDFFWHISKIKVLALRILTHMSFHLENIHTLWFHEAP